MNDVASLFCEDCGYDFTTGQMPPAVQTSAMSPVPAGVSSHAGSAVRVVASGPVEWVAEVWVDPEWFASQPVPPPDSCPSAGVPVVVPLPASGGLIGRKSASRNIHPLIDLSLDSSVSRKHAQLSSDGSRWFVEDLSSTNGVFVGRSGATLPNVPIVAGSRREIGPDERIFVGAWTRVVVRRATDAERGTWAPAP